MGVRNRLSNRDDFVAQPLLSATWLANTIAVP